MRKLIFPFPLILILFGPSCEKAAPPEPELIKTFMLAIIEREGQVPIDFEADEAVGDYKPETGLLRIEGTDMWNGRDKIELTVRDLGDEVVGEHVIGKFDQANTVVKAQFIGAQQNWDARSVSGKLTITKFEEAQSGNAFLLSATFAFEAEALVGKVNITTGEIENAVILK